MPTLVEIPSNASQGQHIRKDAIYIYIYIYIYRHIYICIVGQYLYEGTYVYMLAFICVHMCVYVYVNM